MKCGSFKHLGSPPSKYITASFSGNFFEYAKNHLEAFAHNERLWKLWQNCFVENQQNCIKPEFLSQSCSLYPFQSMKTVRLRVNLSRTFLEDSSLNVRILLLVRDPRGTLQSRKHRDWCPGNPDCDKPENLCMDLVNDYYTTQQLMKGFPNKIRYVSAYGYIDNLDKCRLLRY